MLARLAVLVSLDMTVALAGGCAPASTSNAGAEASRTDATGGTMPGPSSATELAGKPAPAFSLPSARDDGATIVVPSKDVTVLIFFGSWSSGSTQGLAQLEALRQRHAGDGLRVLAVSMDDDRRHGGEFADGVHAGFPIAWAGGMMTPTGRAWASGPYGGENSVFLLDRGGVVRFVHRGAKDGCAAGSPEVENEVAQLLATR